MTAAVNDTSRRADEQDRRLRIARRRPGEARPRVEEFMVTAGPDTTLLDALREIRSHQDQSLTLRYSCCHSSCGVSACPIAAADARYLGPAALAAAWRTVQEPRGADTGQVLAWVDDEQGCWRCHASFECAEVCPSGAEPAVAVMALRGELTRRQLGRLARLGRRAR